MPTSSGHKGEDLIKPKELQRLQIDTEIQIENLHKLAVESHKQTNPITPNHRFKTDSQINANIDAIWDAETLLI